MERLKTVGLLLFAYFSLSLSLLQAQSSSCSNLVNLSVNADCEFTLTPETLNATGPAAEAGSIYFNTRTGSGAIFADGIAQGSLMGIGVPNGGSVQYQLFASDDFSGTMLCWGNINFEIKSVPQLVTSTIEVMCGETVPVLPSIAEIEAELTGACSAPVSDIFVQETVSGEACTGFQKIRTITAVVDYGETKLNTVLRIDTIVETPLTVDMITCPLGGPNKQDAIILKCEDIGDTFPTPEVVEEYAEEGIRAAYPYINKGFDTVIAFVEQVVELQDTTTEKVLYTDDSGQTYWVLSEVITKRDTVMVLPDTTITEVVLSLKGGPLCNLSAKYTDQFFPGCAGPDSKVLRTWSVLDWCNGELFECVQWIIVETEGPKITPIADATADIAPWLCTASYELSAEVDQGCSETIQIIFETSIGKIEDNVLSGLWLGESAEVTVIAIDDCGQRAEETFVVTPMDNLPPVAIANDNINVSLSGDPLVVDPNDDRGTAKVYVDAIDEGSHNAGCGDVNSCLLLKEEIEDPVIIGGKHASVDGKLIYHAKGCAHDGVLPGTAATKTRPATPDIYYVYCKDFVKFCCESIGENSVALVVTNGGERRALAWSTVTVEDKSSPIVICPDPIRVGCDEEFEIPRPVIFNGVCSIDELEMSMAEEFDACGNGVKTVTWTRNGDVICTTLITIDVESGFNPYEIKWPKHFNSDQVAGVRRECEVLRTSTGDPILDASGNEQLRIVEYDDIIVMGEPFECSEGTGTGEPVWCTGSCGLVGVNFEDLNVEAIDACKKIVRKWTLIDWCTWDPNTDKVDDDNDTDNDRFEAVNDEWLGEGNWLTDSRTTEGAACETCDKPAGDSELVYFRYDTVDVDGYYTYDQIIKILDFDDPEVTVRDTLRISIVGGATAKGESFDACFGSDVVTATATDYCGADEIGTEGASWFVQVFKVENGDLNLLETKSSFGSEVSMSTQEGMTGDVHIMRWQVKDGCGNIGSGETYVFFIEDKNPTPLCIQNLSSSTMSTDGSVTIWASDFDAGSFDNCSEVDVFFKDGDGNFTPSLRFECSDIVDGVSQVFDLELFAVDELGNHDFCNVSFRVDDFGNNCEDISGATGNFVSGSIATVFGDRVEEVEVTLNRGMKDMTNVNGSYMFEEPGVQNLQIKAAKNDDYLNGVTSLDIVLIQRHLLGLKEFENPYQYISADVNNDSRVSTIDLVTLRQVILGKQSEFPNNDSWRFISANHEFQNPRNPFPFLEVIVADDFSGALTSQNFVAAKIGDINGNAIANSLLAGENRSHESLDLSVANLSYDEGDEVVVAVSSKEFEEMVALQFTMEIEGLEFVGVQGLEIEFDESNVALLDEETITASWTSTVGVTTEKPLFEMVFVAKKDGQLENDLVLNSSSTTARAYNSDLNETGVTLSFDAGEINNEFALFQNVPNPFISTTNIGFEIPSEGNITLSVYDITGKLLVQKSGSFDKGYHAINLDQTELKQVGVLYYQVEFQSINSEKSLVATKKMILME